MPATVPPPEDVVKENTQPLYAGALAMGFAASDAEELVSETLAAYLTDPSRFSGRSSLSTFLFGILYNKASELRRRRRREEPTEDIEAVFDARFSAAGHWEGGREPRGPESAALGAETLRIIERCAENLSLEQRSAFYLKEAEGAQSGDICNVLGVSPTHLRVLLYRARLKLRECLERAWEKRG